jgi:S1-C subfamily serine protease
MKKQGLSILSTVILLSLVLSACSSPAAIVANRVRALIAQPSAEIKQMTNLPAPANSLAAQPAQAPSAQTGDQSSLLTAYEAALENVYTQVNGSVVNIRVVQQQSAADIQNLPLPFFNNPGSPDTPELPQGPQFSQALGSGVVLDKEGHILTNNHVAGSADRSKSPFPMARRFLLRWLERTPIATWQW